MCFGSQNICIAESCSATTTTFVILYSLLHFILYCNNWHVNSRITFILKSHFFINIYVYSFKWIREPHFSHSVVICLNTAKGPLYASIKLFVGSSISIWSPVPPPNDLPDIAIRGGLRPTIFITFRNRRPDSHGHFTQRSTRYAEVRKYAGSELRSQALFSFFTHLLINFSVYNQVQHRERLFEECLSKNARFYPYLYDSSCLVPLLPSDEVRRYTVQTSSF